MPSKDELRALLRERLEPTIAAVNEALLGRNLTELEPTLQRVGRGGRLPHWFEQLKTQQTLPNMDGKTIGSVVEMLLLAVLETNTFRDCNLPPLRINPARGVDFPDLDLGVKSPSKNWCTSEPFFSAYERLLGNEHDALVLITDYQVKKKTPPLSLSIEKYKYLNGTQIADRNLCAIAKRHREWLIAESEAWAKRVFKFLAFVNQSDWRARTILYMVEVLDDEANVKVILEQSGREFARLNKDRMKKGTAPLPDSEYDALQRVGKISPTWNGVIDAAENWVTDVQKELGRNPNENEWERLVKSPLDGMIGMSLALQWRYNFGQLFGQEVEPEPSNCDENGSLD